MKDRPARDRRVRVAVVAAGTIFGVAVLALGVGAALTPPPMRTQPPAVQVEAAFVELPAPEAPTAESAPQPPVPAPSRPSPPPPPPEPPKTEPTPVPEALPIPAPEPLPSLKPDPPKPTKPVKLVRPAPKREVPPPAPSPVPPVPTNATPPPQAAPTPRASESAAHPDTLGGGTSGARAIYQPAPVIPPELRHQAIDLVAVVRFTVAADGSASVALEQPTPDPRLNQVLLAAFQRWRFFPALQDGKPVVSTLTLRVPVTVE